MICLFHKYKYYYSKHYPEVKYRICSKCGRMEYRLPYKKWAYINVARTNDIVLDLDDERNDYETRFDVIKRFTLDELTAFIAEHSPCDRCVCWEGNEDECMAVGCKEGVRRWLKTKKEENEQL